MLASIPVNEMAETLRVLAGGNAANAARHFTKRSHDIGDVASAVLWSSIAQCLGIMPFAPPEPGEGTSNAAAFEGVPEDVAMQGVRFEDADAEALAREEEEPVSLAPIPQRALKRLSVMLAEHVGEDDRSEPAQLPEYEYAKAA